MVGRSPPAAHPRRTTPRRSAAALRPAHARPSCLHWAYRQPPVTPGDATSPIPGEPDQERSLVAPHRRGAVHRPCARGGGGGCPPLGGSPRAAPPPRRRPPPPP